MMNIVKLENRLRRVLSRYQDTGDSSVLFTADLNSVLAETGARLSGAVVTTELITPYVLYLLATVHLLRSQTSDGGNAKAELAVAISYFEPLREDFSEYIPEYIQHLWQQSSAAEASYWSLMDRYDNTGDLRFLRQVEKLALSDLAERSDDEDARGPALGALATVRGIYAQLSGELVEMTDSVQLARAAVLASPPGLWYRASALSILGRCSD